MNLPRRQFLQLAASAAVLPAASRIARAQVYPSRPVRLLVGFAAGGTTVLEVHPSVAANSVPELIALAKANPGKITLASFGTA